MADLLQTMQHGEPNWDEKVNAIVNYLNNKGPLDNIKYSGWSLEGVVLGNGFEWNSNNHGYRYIQLPGVKLVEVDLKFKPVDHSGNSADNVIILPDMIKADGMALEAGFWGTPTSGVYLVRQWDGQVSINRIDNDPGDKWNGDFYVRTIYMHQD